MYADVDAENDGEDKGVGVRVGGSDEACGFYDVKLQTDETFYEGEHRFLAERTMKFTLYQTIAPEIGYPQAGATSTTFSQWAKMQGHSLGT